MNTINKRLIACALVILGALDLSKDIIGDLFHTMGMPEYTINLVKVLGFLLTAYVAQQTNPYNRPRRTKSEQSI